MKPLRWPRLPAAPAARRINRAPSPLLAVTLPWLSVMLASMTPALPVIASAPIMPPLGFMILLGWRQIRPGLLPVWAGLPLGMWDDLYSGQPFGSAILLWSLAMLGLDALESRFPWRTFAHEWLAAAAVLLGYVLGALAFANAGGGSAGALLVLPQYAISVLLFPLAARLVSALDHVRLMPLVEAR